MSNEILENTDTHVSLIRSLADGFLAIAQTLALALFRAGFSFSPFSLRYSRRRKNIEVSLDSRLSIFFWFRIASATYRC